MVYLRKLKMGMMLTLLTQLSILWFLEWLFSATAPRAQKATCHQHLSATCSCSVPHPSLTSSPSSPFCPSGTGSGDCPPPPPHTPCAVEVQNFVSSQTPSSLSSDVIFFSSASLQLLCALSLEPYLVGSVHTGRKFLLYAAGTPSGACYTPH